MSSSISFRDARRGSPVEPERALVVDDDLSIRESVGQLLENLGYVVSTAEDGRRALSLLEGERTLPQVILLDLMMPVMSGWQFLDERQRDERIAAIPVLVISGALDASAELPNVAGYLRKPVRPEQLVELLDRVRSGGGAPAAPSERAVGASESQHAPDSPPESAADEGHSTGIEKTPLHILLIQESDEDARATEALLGGETAGRFTIRRVRTLAAGLEQQALAGVDVILLDLDLASGSGQDALRTTVRHAPGIPFVVLTRGESAEVRKESLRWGAQDALAKELQTPELLGRALRWACERHRLRRDLEHARELAAYERERRGLAQFAQPRMTIAAEMLGQSSLTQTAPEKFRAFVADFIVICERAVKEREHELDALQQREELQRLADALASLRVGPGDIVDIYQEALAKAWKSENTELGSARREEARLMLIALLGYVLVAYRLYVGADNRPRSVT